MPDGDYDLGSAFAQHAQPHEESDSDSDEPLFSTQTQTRRRSRTDSDEDEDEFFRSQKLRRTSTPVIPDNGPVMDQFGNDYDDFEDWKRRSLVGRVMVGEQNSENDMIAEYDLLTPSDEVIGNQGNYLGMEEDEEEHNITHQAILIRLGLPYNIYIPRNIGGKKKSGRKKSGRKKSGRKKSGRKKSGRKKSDRKKSGKKSGKKKSLRGGYPFWLDKVPKGMSRKQYMKLEKSKPKHKSMKAWIKASTKKKKSTKRKKS
jgi:hypothetical protein